MKYKGNSSSFLHIQHKLGLLLIPCAQLWTLVCVVVGAALFFAFGGWQVLKGLFDGGLRMMLGWLEVLMATVPTTEIPINPWVVALLVGFVLIYLPYQTGRKLSSVL